MTYRTYFIDKIEYNKELDTMLINDNKFLDSEILEEINEHYKGCNRIHKPIALLFRNDVKNNKLKYWNYEKIK